MQKDFDGWNEKKKETHVYKNRPFFGEKEVWYAKLGLNVGFEQDGAGAGFVRPVIIIKKFSKAVFLCVPITRAAKVGKYYFDFELQNGKSTAILSQIRLIDAKRHIFKLGTIRNNDFLEMKKHIISLLE